MTNFTYDVIVIGAGAVGSATAYHAAKRGLRTLLLEQYEIDHGRGSSHGNSRIIRYAYDHPLYVALAKTAYTAWAALEAEAGETFFTLTGGADISRRGEPMFEHMLTSLTDMDIPFELLNAGESMRRFPQFRFDDDIFMLYQADAGILAASRCVLAHVRLAQAHGATVLERTVLTNIAATDAGVTITTTAGTFSGGKLIVAAGAWANDILGYVDLHLPLRPIACQENYFEVDDPAAYEPGRFPVFIAHFPEYGYFPYGIPSTNGSGLKVALHGGPDYDPHTPSRDPDPSVIETVQRYAAAQLPGVGALKSSRVCLYTMTPDEHFIVDFHPQHSNIVIGACCSGHAFKFSTVLGSILVDLAVEGETPHDISLFSLERFGVRV